MDPARRLRILLILKHAGYIGVYASLVRELAERGHSVHIGYLRRDAEGESTLERLSSLPRITYGRAPQRAAFDGWSIVAWLVRAEGDLARFSHPRFANAPALRNRMAGKVTRHLEGASGFDPLTRRLALRRARQLHANVDGHVAAEGIRRSRRLEQAVPTSRRVTAFIREQQPDVLLASPLIDLASPVLEYLKAARELRVPTGICVASWDNLTSKGLLRFVPERVFVWNETQRREAADLHGIPAEQAVATGAARFDDWFAQAPTARREEFTAKLGLDPARPFLLYVCSSAFIVRDEVATVLGWVDALHTSGDERLRTIGVVVRPHPKRRTQWTDVDLSGYGAVVLWPPLDTEHTPAESRAEFYDSVAHSAAVVGANTSAMLEAAILGKPVYTWLAPEFAQEGTIHFHYLLHEQGGFLHLASSLDEHLAQLAAGLGREPAEADRIRRFVESFLRPGGLERPATHVYADAVEELAGLAPADLQRSAGTAATRLALTPVAFVSSVALSVTLTNAAARSRLGEGRAEGRRLRPRPARA